MITRPHTDPSVLIRAARGSDGAALENLARMDSQRPLGGDVLLAEQDGVIVAAIAGARMVADPFRPTADVLALLRMHADGTADGSRSRRRARAPRLRAA
jgi:hypothetical protein